MRPVIKTDDELIKEAIEETAKKTAKTIMDELNSGSSSGSKISRILNNVKSQEEPEKHKGKDDHTEKDEREQAYKELIKKELDERTKPVQEDIDNDMVCPTCHKGHVHTLENSSVGKVKCTGDGCGTEYVLVSPKSDYKCNSCGMPHKRPVEPDEDDKCPFCNSNTFLKYDWGKVIEKSEKKKKK